MKRLLLAAASFLVIASFGAPAALADAPQNATVTITDSGFTPATVNVAAGGTVTFINQGSQVHTATNPSPNVNPFDTGGLSTGQSQSIVFPTAGTYSYSSATDCPPGNSNPAFNCNGTVVVGPAAQAAPAPSSAAASSGQSPANQTVVQTANVSISDTGFTPQSVVLTVGGTVNWTNNGTTVHTASSANAPAVFDTGGLATGQSGSAVLTVPGTYHYSSEVDCLNGNTSTTFSCSTDFIVTVTPAPVGSTIAAPGAPLSGPIVYIQDAGYQPPSITIKAGQTVSWLNLGSAPHSVVSDTGVTPAFNSGGLGTGSSLTVTFANPGTYGYHSAMDSSFHGTVVVQ